jgi:hypothetical protein
MNGQEVRIFVPEGISNRLRLLENNVAEPDDPFPIVGHARCNPVGSPLDHRAIGQRELADELLKSLFSDLVEIRGHHSGDSLLFDDF